MLGNCEKMMLISSASNEWSQQNNQLDEQKSGNLSNNNNTVSVASAAPTAGVAGRVLMDQKVAHTLEQQHHLHHQQQQQKQQQQQQQQQQQNQEPLRCPRCDSTNTKFCYYNNYSLSQPRHFCKACKRYWTRGGTLRNVPVGGGCRKNKRVRRPSHHNTSSSSTNTSLTNNETSVNSASSGGGGAGPCISSLPSGGHHIHELNPLFYGLPSNHYQHPNSDINFPFSRYDLQNPPQINGLGLGFSSGLVHNVDGSEFIRNGLNANHLSNSKQLFQDLISSNPLLSNYVNSNSSNTSTIASLLGANLHHMKGGNNIQTLLPSYEGGHGSSGMFMKGVKMELEGQNRSLDHHWSAPIQNQMEHNMGSGSSSHDPSVIWGNGPNLGAWLDPSNNLGSSVTSLI